MTSKKGNRLFFKGKGGLKPGVHTKFGEVTTTVFLFFTD